jgi:hypothetical protein
VVQIVPESLLEGKYVEPGLLAGVIVCHQEIESGEVGWVRWQPLKKDIFGVVAKLEGAVGGVRGVLVFCRDQEFWEGKQDWH